MGNRTPLYDAHLASGAKMVDFAGWDMPLHYGSQVEEHHVVRSAAGMFDVSHMTVVDLHGARTRAFLAYLVANNVDKLKTPGKALYSCMLNDAGGVIDDLIIYFLREDFFRLVVNSATRAGDLAWIGRQAAAFDVQVQERDDLAMIAIQGPRARDAVLGLLGERDRAACGVLKPFFACDAGDWFVARTGYTGEDGFEIMLPGADAVDLWNALLNAGVRPCGLGARDTLRLEAGMALYGTDMDATISPLAAGLGWTIGWEPAGREFIGRAALERQRADGLPVKFVGLVLEDKGVLRNHQTVIAADGTTGEITSGSFSPTLGRSIALARVPVSVGEVCEVEVRNRRLRARVVKPPFVRNGQALVPL